VPKGDLALVVDGQPLRWSPGKLFTFDDTFVHEVWNRSSDWRAILMIDVKRPNDPTDIVELTARQWWKWYTWLVSKSVCMCVCVHV
jgi:aspartyl/asparaginyl beta-hydroxylase (cupin superfamily)